MLNSQNVMLDNCTKIKWKWTLSEVSFGDTDMSDYFKTFVLADSTNLILFVYLLEKWNI